MTRFCPGCRKIIIHGSLTTQIMSDDYHASCIHCFKCGQNLWQKGFVKRSDGKLTCEEGAPCQAQSASTVSSDQSAADESPRKARNQHANSFSVNDQFQPETNGDTKQQQPTSKKMAPHQNGNHQGGGGGANTYNIINGTTTNPTTNGNSLPDTKYSKYFVDTSPKNSAKNGKNNNPIHSYNMSKNAQGNKRNNDNIMVVESIPHQIETFPVQTESLAYGKEIDSRRSSLSTKTPDPSQCAKCNLMVKEADRVMNNNRAFHKECLTCDSCNTELFKMKKIQYDAATGNHYCEPCYADLFGPKCGKCNKPVTSYMLSATYADKLYHKECFVCGRCKLSLANREFTKIGNLIICKNCL